MTWEELRLKLQAMADRAVATWPDFAAAVGPVHVVQDGEPDTGGGGFMFCNGRFSQGFFVDVYDGEISDESEPGGNGSLALGEMVTKPWHRQPPCPNCGSVAVAEIKRLMENHLAENLTTRRR